MPVKARPVNESIQEINDSSWVIGDRILVSRRRSPLSGSALSDGKGSFYVISEAQCPLPPSRPLPAVFLQLIWRPLHLIHCQLSPLALLQIVSLSLSCRQLVLLIFRGLALRVHLRLGAPRAPPVPACDQYCDCKGGYTDTDTNADFAACAESRVGS
jgi:hypothetical protein